MLKVGLTGGIGCGKSTAIRHFQQLGVPVVEADLIARQVVAVGEPALQDIAEVFGAQALQQDGSLDRAWLRQYVFGNAQGLQALEAILHPRIKAAILADMAAYQGSPYVLVDIPLLFEKGYQVLFDRVLVIDCLPEQQLQRVKQRDGSEDSVIQAIMQAQMSREQRLQQADDVLTNQSTIVAFQAAIERLHELYLTQAHTLVVEG
ncbi:MAG: hypothetical protein RI964_2489 [Pseudomonadota bacterium]|jgi:dephospho-CoA kinase